MPLPTSIRMSFTCFSAHRNDNHHSPSRPTISHSYVVRQTNRLTTRKRNIDGFLQLSFSAARILRHTGSVRLPPRLPTPTERGEPPLEVCAVPAVDAPRFSGGLSPVTLPRLGQHSPSVRGSVQRLQSASKAMCTQRLPTY
ncbi:hypothetical protein AOLI_G00079000 [Acnodon oligacanthus]